MTQDELQIVIKNHEKWLNDQEDGERADLSGADLHGADLHGADLRHAHMCNTDLRDADLRDADLRSAYMRDANLCGANLCGANLRSACLFNANLRRANLQDAYLYDADLRWASLLRADLCGADLHNANLQDANLCLAIDVPFIPMSCPDSGSFTAWKKASGVIVKLLIPEDARRSCATGFKCRCDKAVVLAIEHVDGTPAEVSSVQSDFDSSFVYKVGATVTAPDFCEDRFNECAAGIHFFINRENAVRY